MCARRRSGRLQSGEQVETRKLPPTPLPPVIATSPFIDFTDPSWLIAKEPATNIYSWVLPHSLSQSQFAGRNFHSAACTLIAVSVAKTIHRSGYGLPKTLPRKIPEWMLHVLGNAMLDGNAAHGRAMKERIRLKRTNKKLKDTFTIPQAIVAVGGEVHEIDYQLCRGPSHLNIGICVIDAICSPHTQKLPTVYLLVIMLERAILICFDRKAGMVSFFDSHSHRKAQQGSIIAMAPQHLLSAFCYHLCHILFPEVTYATDHFEISCLQVLPDRSSSSSSGGSTKSRLGRETISAKVFRPELERRR